MQDEEVLVITEFTKHEVSIVKELATDDEAVANSKACTSLRDHCQYYMTV